MREKWPEMCNGTPQIVLLKVAEDEGEEEAHDGNEAHELAALVAAVFLSNIPEGLSSAAGMKS